MDRVPLLGMTSCVNEFCIACDVCNGVFVLLRLLVDAAEPINMVYGKFLKPGTIKVFLEILSLPDEHDTETQKSAREMNASL